jgi:3-methylcrotonyl-CoA carboxylase alpha subunit
VAPVRRFGTLLIANRGEIACRIMRTAKRTGLRTVAVYSDADRSAMHVALADASVLIGRPPAKESYLNIAAIIEAAHKAGAEAVHPGYGFLSENAEFAQACAAAGLVFVGPCAETIRAIGSKAQAKALMQAAGVPIVPGYHGDDQSERALMREAEHIGYPVLVKASAGGGGRGMRVVSARGELAGALAGARREAKSAFGDDRLLIEKYLANPRHIEVQVFGDSAGNVVSLYERECTLQRRHQKVVEEAPSSAVTADRREEMSTAARAAAQAVRYLGAGTVEFIADATGFYFIEMNTRLQVEHPVTELITGTDLVEWQLRVAQGEKLPLDQNAIRAAGHAIEARIYAEDAEKGFLPSTGIIRRWREPAGLGIRVDTGFRAGDTVSPYYDALLAKVIVHAEDREAALARMVAALAEFQITGVTTNVAFLQALLRHPRVERGEIDTGFIERELSALTAAVQPITRFDIAAACASVLAREGDDRPPGAKSFRSPWDRRDGWMLHGRRSRYMSFRQRTQQFGATVWYERGGLSLEVGGEPAVLRFSSRANGDLGVTLGKVTETVSAAWSGRDLDLITARGHFNLHWIDPFAGETASGAGASRIVAPMPGTVIRILTDQGADLPAGAPLLVLEAMKMEHTLRAPAAGRLKAFRCAVGDFVQEGTELADFEPEPEPV